MALGTKTIASTYGDLLEVDNSNSGVDGTPRQVKSGQGSISSIYLGTDGAYVKPYSSDTTATFTVYNKAASTTLLNCDAFNGEVKSLGNHINTQYAYFGITSGAAANLANNHHPIPFGSTFSHANLTTHPSFGTSTDPATSFTTSEGNGTRSGELVHCFWYITDGITIDSVCSIEGADAAGGDTTRMHLMSYDFTSGSTSCLSGGTLLAHNSDVTNAGSEQAYKSNWTIDSSSVASGKVVLAMFRSDSINSDYTINIIVKYHLT